MNWSRIAQASTDVLSLILVVKLLVLRLHSVYRIFCIFLLFDLLGSLVGFLELALHNPVFDYRITWICLRVVAWILSLWMVYGLLQAILAGLPGILRFSRKLLNITFLFVVVAGLLTVKLDSAVSGSSGLLSGYVDPIGRAVRVTFDLERIISTVALLVLLVILAFVLWFPVRMPKNLAVFSLGFVLYFAANTGLLLTRGFWSLNTLRLLSNVNMLVLCACYLYWIVFITAAGETPAVTVGHGWRPEERARLHGQLEALNASLLRAARR